jgi:hypothetical protein
VDELTGKIFEPARSMASTLANVTQLRSLMINFVASSPPLLLIQ